MIPFPIALFAPMSQPFLKVMVAKLCSEQIRAREGVLEGFNANRQLYCWLLLQNPPPPHLVPNSSLSLLLERPCSHSLCAT